MPLIHRMGLSLAMFDAAPSGGTVPTARELQAFAAWNAKSAQSERIRLMNEICGLLGVPAGGWTSPQSRLLDRGDVRLVWLLRRLARKRSAENTVENLQRTTRFVDAEVMLTLVTAARENAGSVGAVTMQPIDTWSEGGLDFLWEERDRLGLPRSITSQWRQVAPFVSPETGSVVHPAEIPARDQVLAYAAQMNASFRNGQSRYRQWLASQASSSFPSDGCRVAMLIWKACSYVLVENRAQQLSSAALRQDHLRRPVESRRVGTNCQGSCSRGALLGAIVVHDSHLSHRWLLARCAGCGNIRGR